MTSRPASAWATPNLPTMAAAVLFPAIAFAGDSFDATLALLAPEVMVPTVFEIADIQPLWMTPEEWALRGYDDRDLIEFVAPPAVPLPGSAWLLAGAVGLLALVKGRRA